MDENDTYELVEDDDAERCPECMSKRIVVERRNGHEADNVRIFVCKECGSTWEG